MSQKHLQRLLITGFILFILIHFAGIQQSLAHGGASNEEDSHYQVSYTEEDISLKMENIEILLGGYEEINVSITEINTSMTIIVEIHKDAGPLWGLYLENQTTYYSAKNGTTNPEVFAYDKSLDCCTKILDHVSYYAVVHVTRPVNDSYVLALYNTHQHNVSTTNFDLVILKGFMGEETYILIPPSSSDPFISLLIIGMVVGIGAFAIGLVTYTMFIRPKKRK